MNKNSAYPANSNKIAASAESLSSVDRVRVYEKELKLPTYRSSPPRLAVELNPVDEVGNPKKRRGLILRSGAELEDFKGLFNFEKLSKLLSMVDSVNPKVEAGRRRKGEEVIEL